MNQDDLNKELDVGCTLVEARELNSELIDKCSEWMDKAKQDPPAEGEKESFEDPFDLAVACAHELEIVNEENDWVIPEYLVELAEEKCK